MPEQENLNNQDIQDLHDLQDLTSPLQPKKKRRFFLVFLGVIALLLIPLSYAGLYAYTFLTVPPNPQAEERIVLIERGMILRSIAERLEQQRVITDKNLFMLLARFYHREKSVKAGEYRFTTAMLPVEVLLMLQDGKIYLHHATIPEGYTLAQIADHLETLGYAEKSAFLQLAANKEFIARLNIEADSLEGYLFPNTYSFPRGISATEIVQQMVNQFWQVMTPDRQQEIRQQGFTVHQIVTLASIVEKEAKAPAERELISAVYHNRLKINMKLDSDPTVIYGIQNFNGNLTRRDLEQDTPYNTYTRRGLPPGPIANPGAASILAAIHPAQVKYLYFVARNDGTHEFSTNYNDHLKAVRKYQSRKRRS
jgi:UPF0755 protein